MNISEHGYYVEFCTGPGKKKKYVCVLMSVEKEDMKAALFKDNSWCFGVKGLWKFFVGSQALVIFLAVSDRGTKGKLKWVGK